MKIRFAPYWILLPMQLNCQIKILDNTLIKRIEKFFTIPRTHSTIEEVLIPSMESEHIIKILKNILPKNPVIIEAGAFDGKDSILMSETWPRAQIYSFEPAPSAYQKLRNATKNINNVHCFELALSNKKGKAILHLSEEKAHPGITSQSSSLLLPEKHLEYATFIQFPQTICVETITLDDWCLTNNVKHVDLLWLDLQGMELPVLNCADLIIPTVMAIYIEVSFVEAYKKQALFDEVDQWLKNKNFTRIARDFHIPLQEEWFGNCIYVRKGLTC